MGKRLLSAGFLCCGVPGELIRVAHATEFASDPELPRVSSPLIDELGALQIRLRIARSNAATARWPVEIVDLPETHINRRVSILVHGIRVSGALVLHDALAARLPQRFPVRSRRGRRI